MSEAADDARPAAVIDIGSNTTRLLVARRSGAGLRRLLSHRAFTRLARGIGPDGAIRERRLADLVAAVTLQQHLTEVLEAGLPAAIATAAVRDAVNGDEALARIRAATGIEPVVLDPQEEARLAFLGATNALPLAPSERLAVIDVGGGSTEVAVGSIGDGVEWSTSLALGSARLTDRLLSTDPPAGRQVERLKAAVDEELADVALPGVRRAIAIGGSASSLRRLVGNVLDHETLERATRLICDHPAAVVAEEFGVEVERVQVLLAGVVVLEALSDRLGLALRIGKGGVREGKLLELTG